MAVHGGPNIIEDGLVLCLDAGNRRSYPGSGTAWTDLANNVTTNLTNMTSPFSSSNGGYLQFDGTNDHSLASTRTTNTEFQYNSAFTVSAFCRVEENTATGYIIHNRFTDAGGVFYCGWGLCQNAGSIIAFVGGNPSNLLRWRNAESSTTTFNNEVYNKWAHITYVNTGSAGGQKIYINGVDRTSSAYDNNNATPHTINYSNGNSRVYVGGDVVYNTHYLQAKIAHATVHNRALSATEIMQNFAALRGRYGI